MDKYRHEIIASTEDGTLALDNRSNRKGYPASGLMVLGSDSPKKERWRK
jgi:hypothetical protein